MTPKWELKDQKIVLFIPYVRAIFWKSIFKFLITLNPIFFSPCFSIKFSHYLITCFLNKLFFNKSLPQGQNLFLAIIFGLLVWILHLMNFQFERWVANLLWILQNDTKSLHWRVKNICRKMWCQSENKKRKRKMIIKTIFHNYLWFITLNQ